MENTLEEVSGTASELSVDQQWVHLLPVGKIAGQDGRNWKLSDPHAFVVESIKHGRDLPIDYEHQSDLSSVNGQPAPAAGWIEQLEIRDDGIWGFVRWTERARKMIEGREYRFLSPVFYHEKETGEARKLIGAGLTNAPNLNLKALNKWKADSDGQEVELLKELVAVLKLKDGATHQEVLDAVKELSHMAKAKNSAVPVEQVSAVVTEYNSYRADVEQREAEQKVKAAMVKGILPPAMKEWAMSLCRSDPGAFDEFVTKSPVLAITRNSDDEFTPEQLDRVLNKATDEETLVSDLLGIDADGLAES